MYQLTNTPAILRIQDGAYIPADPANTDYAEYLKWLSKGNQPEPVPIQVKPKVTLVSMRQARLALLGAGLLSTVNDAIAAMQSPQKDAAGIEWEYAQVVERTSPFTQVLAAGLGLTEEQLDVLFETASTL